MLIMAVKVILDMLFSRKTKYSMFSLILICISSFVYANSTSYYNSKVSAHNACRLYSSGCGYIFRSPLQVFFHRIYSRDENDIQTIKYVSFIHNESPYAVCYHPDSNGLCSSILVLKEKEVGKSYSCKAIAGNPISITSGNKLQKESFITSSLNYYFNISLFYNSQLESWTQPYSQSVKVAHEGSSLMEAQRDDGKTFVFKSVNGAWKSDADVTAKLSSFVLPDDSNGWQLSLQNNRLETYNASGKLLSISKLGKQLVSLNHDDSTHTTVVTDSLTDNSMTLTYDAIHTDRLISVTDTDNSIYRFGYADNGVLQYVSFPDDTSSAGNNPFLEDNTYREYHYDNATNGKLLTGITDELGNRYATWAYDDQGRAISSEHANTTEKASLDYTHQEDATDPRVTVTNALGKQTTYHFEALHGVRKVTKVEGHQSANCAAANKETTYDENGFVASQTDWRGNLTTYINNDRGLETSRTVASGTPQAQTITTVWHDSFNQPQSITEPSRVTTFTYDNQGQRLTTTITDNP